jgi:hypothetical protein
MSWLSDIAGGGAQKAATAQETGLLAGMYGAEGYLNQNPDIIRQYGAQALAPYQTNWNTSQQGVGALGNLLGLNGPAGTQSALTQLETTPGYQFTLGQGNNAINAAAAANGTLNSGNQLTALANYDTGLAQNTYQNAVANLAPYMNLANTSAGGIAGINQNEAAALTGNNNILAQLLQATYTGIGNAQANADLRQGAGDQSILGGVLGLGSSLLGGLGGLGGIGGAIGGLAGGLGDILGGGGGLIDNAVAGESFLGGSSLFG